MSVTFKLEDFEGPLDLLLYLIEKNKMSIYDIQIAEITDQYMVYLEGADQLELEQTSEFILMAATLLFIKSKLLLPKDPKNKEMPEEDPREELVAKLLEYKKIKYISQELDERQGIKETYCFRNREVYMEEEERVYTTEEILQDLTLENLYQTFKNLMKTHQLVTPKEQKINYHILKKDSFTIEEKSRYIMNNITLFGQTSFFKLCPVGMPKVELIVTFMALLELIHKKQVTIRQASPFEDILIEGVKSYA